MGLDVSGVLLVLMFCDFVACVFVFFLFAFLVGEFCGFAVRCFLLPLALVRIWFGLSFVVWWFRFSGVLIVLCFVMLCNLLTFGDLC